MIVLAIPISIRWIYLTVKLRLEVENMPEFKQMALEGPKQWMLKGL